MVKSIFYRNCSDKLLKWLTVKDGQGTDVFPKEVLGTEATNKEIDYALLNYSTILTNNLAVLEIISKEKISVLIYTYNGNNQKWILKNEE